MSACGRKTLCNGVSGEKYLGGRAVPEAKKSQISQSEITLCFH